MSPVRRIAWFLVGFAGSFLLASAFTPGDARAQSASNIAPGSPTQRRAAPPVRRQQIPAPLEDEAPAPVQPIARSPLDNTTDANPETGDEQGDESARARIPQDGDPVDGVALRGTADDAGDPVEGQAVRDGDDAERFDQRARADVEALERPAAGYDALAFQVEETDPILDRRPARLARFEPYDPLGIRRGSWVIFPQAEFGVGATNNVLRDPSRRGALYFDVRPTLRAVTDWRKHAVEVSATGLASIYGNGFSAENDRSYAFEARSRVDLTRRSNITVLASTSVTQDSRGGADAPNAAAARPDVTTTRIAAAFNHRFNRLSLQLRGGYTDTDFGSVSTLAGGTITNAERDNVARDAAVRATWAFKPTLSAFAEVGVGDRKFKAPAGDGILRDANGERYRFGIGFGEASRIWRGEVALGYGQERSAIGGLPAIAGMIFDANLGWRVSGLSSLLFSARTDFNPTNATGSLGAVSRQFGIEARHAFRTHLIGTAAIRHTIADYKGIALRELETSGELGAEYFFSRNASVFGRYTHLIFDSSAPGADYSVDTVRVGMKIRQ